MGLRAFSLAVLAAALLAPAAPAFAAEAPDADSLVQAGRQAVEQGSVAQGVAFFQRSLAITPSGAVLVEMGCALADLERWEEAQQAFQRALDAKRDDAAALNGLGYVYYRQAKIPEAIDCYRQALAGRDDPQFRLNLGLAYLAQERWGAAAEEFKATVAAQPNDYWGHNDLGYALQRCGQLDAAAHQFGQAIGLRRDDVTAYLNLGGLMVEVQGWDGAARVYGEALKHFDKSPEAHLGLAIAYSHLGRLAEGQREARIATTLAPERPQAYHLLAEIYRKEAHWPAAIAAARKACALASSNLTYQQTLAWALEGGGLKAEAATAYERVALLDPEGKQGRDARMHARLLR